MDNFVEYRKDDNIAIITLNYPPVNRLNADVRLGIYKNFELASEDRSVDAIIITSAAKVFCSGADISEFKDSDKIFAEPSLPDLNCRLEESEKPIIAALNGTALGGGLELALACDYRISMDNIKLGLPEVKLGIIPSAGGTQRLPRLVGVERALNMIVTGNSIDAALALSLGLVDRVHSNKDTFLVAVIDYAKEIISGGSCVRSCLGVNVDVQHLPKSFFNDYRSSLAKGFFAPERCIQAVEASCSLPLYEGLKKELSLALECLNTPQARAQQHLFFAERASTYVPDINPKTPQKKINKIAIIGSGTMGGGIAMNFINVGIETIILDVNGEALEKGIGHIRRNYEISVKKGRMTEAQVEQCLGLLHGTTSYDSLKNVDLVIEAVFENMDVKKEVFKKIDGICKAGAILATNTSTLDVNEIAESTSRPQDVIGLHFFSPANVMRLLEVVRGDKTADDVIVTTLNIAKLIRKTPVVVGVCFGFVGNRMIEPYIRETSRLMLEGATPEQIDNALTNFGMVMGPAAMSDMAGMDVGYLVRKAQKGKFFHDPSYQAIGDKLFELGRLGQKTGRGFYIYEGREKKNDPEFIDLCLEVAKEYGIEQRIISDEEIVERCIFPLINEGMQVLDEGIAYRSGDCDLIYTNGYGFPVWRGGPMQYADEIGLDKILSTLNHYHNALGDYGKIWFNPAPLLQKMVKEGKSLKDLSVKS